MERGWGEWGGTDGYYGEKAHEGKKVGRELMPSEGRKDGEKNKKRQEEVGSHIVTNRGKVEKERKGDDSSSLKTCPTGSTVPEREGRKGKRSEAERGS